MNCKSVFFRIYGFFLIFILAVNIGRGFLSLWFIQNGFGFPQITLFYFIAFLVPSLILLFAKKFSTARSFTIALISEILLMLSVFHFHHPLQLYFAGVFAGATVVFFYITYNTLYFENTPKDKRAFSSSLFTLAGPFLGILVPLAVGFFGQKWGLSSIFLVAASIYLINLYLIRFLPKIEIECNLRQNLIKTSRINFLLLLEGIKESVYFAAIPIFTLFFINQPLPYGAYFSYLAFISIAATMFFGFLSDKFKKRAIILYPVTIMVALTIIALGFAQSLSWWTIISGALGFLLVLNGTFVTTLVLDQVSEVKVGMISREFLLGVGRTIGMAIVFASLALFNSPKLALILIGSLYLLFPLTVYVKKIYQKGLLS
ncbi:MFS transporter [Patescibacteria group bacterium]|nr:MFS transporter [Patescibacteria group bacterium]